MKISFSTLGCPEWSWEEIIATAKDFEYDGIEIRGIENELFMPKAKPFLPQNICKTKNGLAKMGLKISCLTSSCYLQEGNEKTIIDAKRYIDLAEELNIPYIRVLGDTNPESGHNVNVQNVINSLKELAKYAVDTGVTILIETNGVFADSNKLKDLIEKVNSDTVGVLWDIHHPYRFMKEPVIETYENLKDYIKHIHVKDSIVEGKKIQYKIMGQGDVPIEECLKILKSNTYDGYISLEWVKRWYSALEEPGIVFLQFKNYIKDIWEKI